MRVGPSLVIIGALIGSMLVAAFGLFVSASAAPSFENGSLGLSAAGDQDESSPENGQAEQPVPVMTTVPLTESGQEAAQTDSDQESSDSCEVSDAFPQGILQWCDLITQYAHQRDLPPNLVAAVMLQESGGQAEAYSRSGAVGLLQVMPRDGIASTFMCKNGPCFTNRPSIAELEDPEFNIEYGTGMLASLVSKTGSFRDALFSYGPMDVGYSYADKVLAIYERYSD